MPKAPACATVIAAVYTTIVAVDASVFVEALVVNFVVVETFVVVLVTVIVIAGVGRLFVVTVIVIAGVGRLISTGLQACNVIIIAKLAVWNFLGSLYHVYPLTNFLAYFITIYVFAILVAV